MKKTSEPINTTAKNNDRQLFGRREDTIKLKNLYKNVEQGKFEVVFISGLSGIGKTTFIRQAMKSYITQNVFYVYGKCNQYSREPYLPFIEAFRMLINQILTEPRNIMERWSKRIVNTIGENCSILMDMIPELELLIGKVSKLKTSDSHKLKARLESALKRLIHLVARKNHPLIMVFDDLQWADPETLQLINVIISDDCNQYILLINIYRSEEVKNNYWLGKIVQSLDETMVNKLSLDALTFHDTKALLELRCSYAKEQIHELLKPIYRKTLGNPFYIEQIITVLKNEIPNMISEKEKSQWMIKYINALTINESIIELIINRLKMLPRELIHLLVYASYLGRKFDIKTLSIILNCTAEQIYNKIIKLTNGGFLIPLMSLSENIEKYSDELLDMEYEFSHDHIQQASYELIPREERKAYHFNIGRVLLENLDDKSVENKILHIIPHFNKALDLIHTYTEKQKIISLNLLAGKKSKSVAAYQSALEYLHSAMTLLPNNPWQKCYDLCFNLHFELAECEFLCNSIDKSEAFFEILIENTRNKNQKSDIYAKRTVLYSCNGQYAQAIKMGIKALKNIDIYIPKKITQLHILIEVTKALWRFRDSRFFRLEKNEHIPPKKVDKAIEILNLLTPSANITDDNLFVLIILKMANLSAKYGTTPYSSIGYCGYSIVLGSILGNFRKADELKKIALSICDLYGDKGLRCIVYFIVGSFIHHWIHDLDECLQFLREACDLGIDSGEYMHVGYSITILVELNLHTQKHLNDVEKVCHRHFDFANSMQFYTLLNSIIMVWELSKFFQYEEEKGEYFLNNPEIEIELIENNGEIICYYFLKSQILYSIGHYDKALVEIEKSVKRIESIKGYFYSADINFYHSLILAASYCSDINYKKHKMIKKIKSNQKKLKKWAENSPKNFRHKYLLIEAELSRCQQKEKLTSKLYNEAITIASDSKFLKDLAISNECAAKYYLSKGLDKIASIYFYDAYRYYYKWGAIRKAKKLMKEHKELIAAKCDNQNEKEMLIMSNTIKKAGFAKDRDSMVVKYLQDLINAKNDNDLLAVFLSKTMELSKANRGYVLIEVSDQLKIEAYYDPNNRNTTPHIFMEEIHDFPKKVVRYTARAYRNVIINPQKHIEIFNNDKYINKRGKVTLASIPLMVDNIFIGILYLEDTLNRIQFIPELVNKIHVLTAQFSYIKRAHTLHELENEGKCQLILQQPLSQREIEILILISNGKTNKEIAEELYLTMSTVKSHASNIYSKLGVKSRLQAVIQAREIGILE